MWSAYYEREQIERFMRNAGVAEADLPRALTLFAALYLDYARLIKREFYDPASALFAPAVRGGSSIAEHRELMRKLEARFKTEADLFAFSSVARMIDEELRDDFLVKERPGYAAWAPERGMQSEQVDLELRPTRSLFEVGHDLSSELKESEIIGFMMIMDELVAKGIARRNGVFQDRRKGVEFIVFEDASAPGGLPGRILFNDKTGQGIWENRVYALAPRFAEIRFEPQLEAMNRHFKVFIDHALNDVAELFVVNARATQPPTTTGTPF